LGDYVINHFGFGILTNLNKKTSELMEIVVLTIFIGLPQKDGNDKPLYDYQKFIFDSLVTHDGNKHLWIKQPV
jgi:hypothetical protein